MPPAPDAPATRLALSWRLWAASFAFWTAFGVVSAGQIYVRESGGAPGAPVRGVFNIVYFYWAWALLTPAVLRLAAALVASDRPWWRRIVAHLPVAAAVILAQSALYALFAAVDGRVAYAALPLAAGRNLVRHLAGNALTYATIVAAYAAYDQARRSREREREAARLALRASELEALLARTRLESLEAQLQPHFLFNTLNIISTLVIRGDAAAADRAIACLGDLLRASLTSSAGQEVTLREELDLARRYLEIARLRFGDRLTVTERVAHDALGAHVPTLILQPLIENAVAHGVAKRARGGRVEIAAEREGAALVVSVRDDGPGFGAEPLAGRRGVGLANVRARLALLHGDRAQLTMADAPDGGAVVTLRILSRVAAARRDAVAVPAAVVGAG